MDTQRFDALVRRINAAIPRRSTLTGALVTLTALAVRREADDVAAKRRKRKKKKKCKGDKKKCGKKCILKSACCGDCNPGETCCDGTCVNLQTDAGHCGNCNATCGAGEACFDGQCLTGLGTCAVGDDFCLSVQDVCNDNDTCQCHVSFTGETRCASFPVPPFVCGECTTDAECANRGPGAFCARDTGDQCICQVGQGFCLIPCVFPIPD